MTEEWKDIYGWEGKYQISSASRLKRLGKIVTGKHGRIQTLKEKILKPWSTRDGYLAYKLVDSSLGKEQRITIHRMVAIHFIPNPENKAEVNHKNGVKSDSRIENLEWATKSENTIHSFKILGRKKSVPFSINPYIRGSRSGINSFLSRKVKQINPIDNTIINVFNSIGEAVSSGAASDSSTVSKCCRGKKNHHNKFKWAYHEG